MSALVTSAIALVGGFMGVALGDVLSNEIRARLDKIPHAIVQVAVLRLPVPLRRELSDEWSAELTEILRGHEALAVTRLWVGVRYSTGLLRSSAQVGRALSPDNAGDPLPSELSGLSYSGPELELIRQAYVVAAHWHRDQWRRSGDPYVTHCVAVARILADLGMDAATVCAGLLHDVPADTGCPPDRLLAEFGSEIMSMVGSVIGLDPLPAESVAVMLENTDRRVLAVKLADRLHNMQTINHVLPDMQRRKSRETLDLLAPVAGRLGLDNVKEQLEDLALATLLRSV
jgi:hypothetical protein